MSQESLADRAVATLAEVRAIGDSLTNDHPMRHSVRGMKMAAEQILADAMRQAADLAYRAKQLVKDHEDAMEAAQSKEGGAE